MSEERTKRREEIIWEKAKEIWKDWKVTISILWFLFIFITAFGAWGIFYWLSRNFSGEIDAAMINSLVSIFVTVPITLLTGAGTILVTVYFNLQTQKMAIQSQRSAIRDKILEKRLEIYPQIQRRLLQILEYRKNWDDGLISNRDFLLKARELVIELIAYTQKHEAFLSSKLNQSILGILLDIDITLKGRYDPPITENDLIKDICSTCLDTCVLIRQELNLEAVDEDWKFLQKYRIDLTSENKS